MYGSEHMFVYGELTSGGVVGTVRGHPDPPGPPALGVLAERARPTSTSRTRVLVVHDPLAPCLPDGGLRRGSVVRCSGEGSLSLALALIGRISGTGSWCGLVGVGDVGALAMVGYGVDLDRLAVIHAPPVPWTQVVGMLLDGMDVVVANSSGRPRPAAARQLVARARHRHAVLVVVGTSPAWPAPADVHLRVTDGRWQGLGRGFGSLQARRVSVVVQGHGSGARPVERELWLPDAAGRVAPA